MEKMLPDLLALGSAEHFLTDYGDEIRLKLSWEIFDKDAATNAFIAARHSIEYARHILELWSESKS